MSEHTTIDVERIRAYEAEGWLRIQPHPSADLFIVNYTPRCQFGKHWDDLTLMCRGLIFTSTGEIAERPFGKFFNMGEGWRPNETLPLPPAEPFEVTEKLDGSLGILYWIGDEPRIASRGSFTSEQAARGTAMLAGIPTAYCRRDRTYLFEIIYPENRIVVDYGPQRELILLAEIDKATGRDLPLELSTPSVRRFEGIAGIEQLMAEYQGEDNFEGFVLRYESGLRLKVKLPEYVRLHKLLTGVNSRHIWEMLAAGQSISPLLERVPDEFYEWVSATANALRGRHDVLMYQTDNAYREIIAKVGVGDPNDREWKKAFASAAVLEHGRIQHLLFARVIDGDVAAMAWREVRPAEAERPYKDDPSVSGGQ